MCVWKNVLFMTFHCSYTFCHFNQDGTSLKSDWIRLEIVWHTMQKQLVSSEVCFALLPVVNMIVPVPCLLVCLTLSTVRLPVRPPDNSSFFFHMCGLVSPFLANLNQAISSICLPSLLPETFESTPGCRNKLINVDFAPFCL